MDASNIAAIKRAAEHWKSKHPVPADYQAKVRMQHKGREATCSTIRMRGALVV
jgi:hypothetical protein